MSTTEMLKDLEQVMATAAGRVSQANCLSAADAILLESDAGTVREVADHALRVVRKLYGQARSLDALPISLALFQRASDIGDLRLTHNAAVVSGVLSSDTADFAGSLEFHSRALDLMNGQSDRVGASGSWSNIGSALCGVGRYELAAVSFRHALTNLETAKGPQFSRYSALGNLAQCDLHTGQIESGLKSARLALKELELGRSTFPADPFSELLLRRNMVRLLVASGDLASADGQIEAAKVVAKQDGGPRAAIALATAQAVVEIARGNFDVAGTRLERCLTAARPMRPALRDTLACMVRADEATGNAPRALLRLQELSELMHDAGSEAALAHIGLADWRRSITAFALPTALSQTHARLVRTRGAASVPAMWPTVSRLALGNALQIDPSAAHGIRVGALSRMLAQACRLGPIQALEIGLAAQVHDVGIAADQENLLGHFGNPSSEGAAAEEDFDHCEAGWNILSHDDHPRVVIAKEIAKYHHAWVNGEGHPGGITGRSIPLHARICAVADTYDNIMQGAAHPSGEDTIATGLARLKALAGKRLDPELVELFVETVEHETLNEGIELESGHGLTSFHQLINSLSGSQRYI